MVLVLGSILVVIEDSWGWYYAIEWGRWNSGECWFCIGCCLVVDIIGDVGCDVVPLMY